MCTWGVYLLEQWLWETIGTWASTSAYVQVVLHCFTALRMFPTQWPLDDRWGPQHWWDFIPKFPLRDGVKPLIFLLSFIRKPWTVVKVPFLLYSHGKFSLCCGIFQNASRIFFFKFLRIVAAPSVWITWDGTFLFLWTQSLRETLV